MERSGQLRSTTRAHSSRRDLLHRHRALATWTVRNVELEIEHENGHICGHGAPEAFPMAPELLGMLLLFRLVPAGYEHYGTGIIAPGLNPFAAEDTLSLMYYGSHNLQSLCDCGISGPASPTRETAPTRPMKATRM